MAPICFIMVIGIFLYLGNFLTTDAYEDMAKSIRVHDTYYSGDICQYGDCENPAKETVELRVMSASPGFKRVLGIENKADFSVKTDSFSYTPTEKRVSIDREKFLVPQADGSLKVEKRTYLTEYETKGKTATYSYVNIEGAYCKEHCETAKETLEQELKTVMVDKNPTYLILMIIIPIVLAIAGICVEVYIIKFT